MIRRLTIVLGILALLVATIGCATTGVAAEDSTVSKVLEFPALTPDQGYARSLEWMAQAFVSSQSVIQLQDEERNRIVGRGAMDITYTLTPIRTTFLISIEHREGRARIELSQPATNDPQTAMVNGPLTTRTQLRKFEQKANALIADWENSLRSETESW
jgi:hypothetical protein